MNKKMIIGIAAAAAAVAVIGMITKKTGVMDKLIGKLHDLSDAVEDKMTGSDKRMQSILPKGEDKNVSNSITSHN